MRLTDESIAKRKRPKEGQQFDWDELVSGFGVRFTPSATTFVVQWREADGSKSRESLRPRWPTLSTLAARDLARKRLSEVLGSKEAGSDVPLRLALRTWFERQTELKAWRPRYRAKVDAIISSYIEGEERPRLKLTPTVRKAIEEIGAKPVGSISRSDVMRLVNLIKPGVGEQLMGAVLSPFFNSLYEAGIVTGNPAKNRLRVTGGRRVRIRHFTDAEFLRLWRGFEAEGDPNFGAFAMLAYTGTRRREVTGMRWDELDLDAATWTLQSERRKTGRRDPMPFVITLHPAALATIKRQPVLEGSPYVFWGRRDKRPFDFQHPTFDRVRAAANVDNWRLHDIRRFVRSGMSRLGISQTVAEMCLGHIAKSGLVGVYDQYAYSDEKRAAWLAWGDYLKKITS